MVRRHVASRGALMVALFLNFTSRKHYINLCIAEWHGEVVGWFKFLILFHARWPGTYHGCVSRLVVFVDKRDNVVFMHWVPKGYNNNNNNNNDKWWAQVALL